MAASKLAAGFPVDPGVTHRAAGLPYTKLLGILVVLLGCLLLAAAVDFLLTVTQVLQPLDRALTDRIAQFHPAWLTLPMVAFTLLGDDPPLDIFALAIAFWAFRRNDRLDAALLLGVAAATRIAGVLLKYLAQQPRPSLTAAPPWPLISLHGYGYPSGHAILSMAILGFGAVVLARLLKGNALRWPAIAICLLFIPLIGWSRVYLGFHWINDVIGGYLDGAAIAVTGWVARTYVRMHEEEQHGSDDGRLVG